MDVGTVNAVASYTDSAYIGSVIEAAGDGMAWVGPPAVYGSQCSVAISCVVTVLGALAERWRFMNEPEDEMGPIEVGILATAASLIIRAISSVVDGTATKVQAFGRCLQDQNRFIFTGC